MPSDLASPPVIVTDLIRVSAPSAAEAVSIVSASVAAFPRAVSPPDELTLNPENTSTVFIAPLAVAGTCDPCGVNVTCSGVAVNDVVAVVLRLSAR